MVVLKSVGLDIIFVYYVECQEFVVSSIRSLRLHEAASCKCKSWFDAR